MKSSGTYGCIAYVGCNIAELIVMTRYFLLLETRNCFANDGLWHGRARGAAAACGRDMVADVDNILRKR